LFLVSNIVIIIIIIVTTTTTTIIIIIIRVLSQYSHMPHASALFLLVLEGKQDKMLVAKK